MNEYYNACQHYRFIVPPETISRSNPRNVIYNAKEEEEEKKAITRVNEKTLYLFI